MHLGKQPLPDKVDSSDHKNLLLRHNVMDEEIQEFQHACWLRANARNLEEVNSSEAMMVDALVDALYTIHGTALAMGVDLDPFWDAVHAANMSKVDGSLGPLRVREDGKILKPPGWRAPDILALLKRIKEAQNGK